MNIFPCSKKKRNNLLLLLAIVTPFVAIIVNGVFSRLALPKPRLKPQLKKK